VFKQCPAGTATGADGQLVTAQPQQLTKRPTGLQGEGAQAHGKGAAHALLGVCQSVHDAGIRQGFSAPGRCHVDDESALALAAITHGLRHLECFVLPAVAGILGSLFQRPMASQSRQVQLKARQGVADFTAVLRHAQQVLVQRLIELTHLPLGIGIQRVIFLAGDPACCGLAFFVHGQG